MSLGSIECPCCGVHRVSPRPPRIGEVRWADCACSDSVTCLAHQLGSEDLPIRPPDAVLAERGERGHKIALADFAESAVRWAAIRERITELLEPNDDDKCPGCRSRSDDRCPRCRHA